MTKFNKKWNKTDLQQLKTLMQKGYTTDWIAKKNGKNCKFYTSKT